MKSFEELGLSAPLLKGIEELGYESPTPIQEQTIEMLLGGRDVVAQAQTGTGKTAAFALPVLENLDAGKRVPQALILAPTRELAMQVAEMTHALGRFKNVHLLAVYGGQPIERQLRALKHGVQVVVGTPGRILDHLRRETLNLSQVRTVVLDEGDQMLDMGFLEEIEEILEQCPEERQTVLFSATMPRPIAELARRFLKDPAEVKIQSEQMSVPTIEQIAYEVPARQKQEALIRILDHDQPDSAIIFCRTKQDTATLAEELEILGYEAAALHGDINQSQRESVLRRFREGVVECLVATDVAARGLDIENVSHVINYDVPGDPESYVHRIGRTGRAGREGIAVTFVTPRERNYLRTIERITRHKIPIQRLPSVAEIANKRMQALRSRIETTLESGGLDLYLMMAEELCEDHDPREVAAAAIRMLAESEGIKTQEDKSFEGVHAESGMTRLFLPLGRNAGIHPRDIVGAIANETDVPARSIGAIDIYATSTFVDVPEEHAGEILHALNRTTLKGRKVRVDIARPDQRDGRDAKRGREENRGKDVKGGKGFWEGVSDKKGGKPRK
ncbi:MAG: DEAD/DEAH box helicase [Armatimonadetes bacterium]|nr:DEAD/DEAH box helicase [Armatimonadota bacterium]